MRSNFKSSATCALLAGFATLATAIRPLGSSFGIPGDNATFEYIVVGGGNAGLTLATRLAEQQGGRVAVVEAGSFYEIGNGNRSQVPFFDHYYISKAKDDWQPQVDWGYITSPQKVRTSIQVNTRLQQHVSNRPYRMHTTSSCIMHAANVLAVPRRGTT